MPPQTNFLAAYTAVPQRSPREKNTTYFLIILFFSNLNIFADIPHGEWHAGIKLNDTLELPFTFTSDSQKIIIHNGEENITVDEIKYSGDSVFIQMPVFDSEFRCRFSEKNLTGNFYNHARKSENVFEFNADRGLSYRFSDRPEAASQNISGRYHVIFDGEDEESKDAVGIFKQEGNRVTGTFLTTTGDYRYLEGELNGNRLWLSAFDGSHLFLFTALIKNDSLYSGEFFSGAHWHDTWKAVRDENFNLAPAESFTKSKEITKLAFSFPDENGKMISLDDKRYENKPVIIQIMGTWCPNCLDETRFLATWYKEKNNDVEVIALDYEKIPTASTANKNIQRLKSRFDIKYPILFAGTSDKKEASKALPALNRIFAYPTTIFLDRKKNIVKIHSGFSGPATGEDFEKFKKWFYKTVDSLL